MNMKRIQRFFTAIVVILGMFALAVPAVGMDKGEHHNGKELLGEHIKTNGHHVIHKKQDQQKYGPGGWTSLRILLFTPRSVSGHHLDWLCLRRRLRSRDNLLVPVRHDP